MDIGEWVTPMSPVVKVVVDSLLGQLPVIGVFVVGMVIGLVYMNAIQVPPSSPFWRLACSC